jgi:hypothetical protein
MHLHGYYELDIHVLPDLNNTDSLVGIATGYGLEDRGVVVRVPVGPKIFFLHVVQTGSGVHPTFYPRGTRELFSRGKAAGAWSWPLTSN